jgi:hypothetical protein
MLYSLSGRRISDLSTAAGFFGNLQLLLELSL